MSSPSVIQRTPLYEMTDQQLRFISGDKFADPQRREIARELLAERYLAETDLAEQDLAEPAESAWDRPWGIPPFPDLQA